MNKIKDINPEELKRIQTVTKQLSFTKNFRSATAEEWFVFIPGFKDPVTGGAAGKAIVHYNLYGNKDMFINTTVILDDPVLFEEENFQLVYSICDELVNRLVGYADTLLSVHAGSNSYNAEYKR
ncbi:hypothetical protein QUF94_15905 [Peribacillus sp. NJ4]|uniref:hypothetical protein n=1 Tax=Peribacillus TaxID=2675229 RepID=UPI0025A12B47|nr:MULTISPECIES: hypothetical protein [unclassified Peribacillus]MDM5212909.1 hypothetical protein [Peribacillus sp. NJ4]MDM5223301.1 hypothetical protein [Peribacillus sp. NJ11]